MAVSSKVKHVLNIWAINSTPGNFKWNKIHFLTKPEIYCSYLPKFGNNPMSLTWKTDKNTVIHHYNKYYSAIKGMNCWYVQEHITMCVYIYYDIYIMLHIYNIQYVWINLKCIMPSKRSQTQRLHIIWFHLYDILKMMKLQRQDSSFPC